MYAHFKGEKIISHEKRSLGQCYFISSLCMFTDGMYVGVWSEWEQQLMEWTVMYGTIHVILGTVLDSDRDGLRDEDHNYNQ